jgi:hypothetical protein
MLAFSAVETASPTVVAVDPDDEERVLDTLTRAFATDPPCRWLYPDER